jgi:serine/threonine protein kinase
MSESHSERASLLPPHHTELARYVPVRALGSGGMAETFVARSVDAARPELVCLKRLRPALATDPVQRAHFADEARVLSRLCHPNVLCVLDAGTDLEGPFLVTELVEGLDLRRLLSWLGDLGEPMPEAIALRIAHELAEALSHAHAHGVVHRDVTPANVLLGRDGRVVLIDFGIARSDTQTQRTRTGLVKGKAAYMAPEQALGSKLDARTDLFALGVMLFEMLGGHRPHDGASDVETVTNALRGKRRPLGRPLETSGLEALLDSLLHPQTSHRPAEAMQVVRALGGASLASTAELAAWVRTACETPGRTGSAIKESGTRKSARSKRPETLTVPEHAIHTSEIPGGAIDAIEAGAALPHVRGWRPELDPPTTLDHAQQALHDDETPEAPLGDDTVVMPRFEEGGDEDAPRTEICPAHEAPREVALSGERGRETLPALAPRSAPTAPPRRPRRMAVMLRTGATLAGGLLAGAVTGGTIALLLRCVM